MSNASETCKIFINILICSGRMNSVSTNKNNLPRRVDDEIKLTNPNFHVFSFPY